MIQYIITCESCGHQFRYTSSGEKESEGWLEVYEGESDESRDFCTRECVTRYYSSDQDQEEA